MSEAAKPAVDQAAEELEQALAPGNVSPVAEFMDRPLRTHAPSPNEIAGSMKAMWDQANWLAQAGLGGSRANVAEIACRIMQGFELGEGPMWSIRHIYVVFGRTGMSAEAMRARFFARCPHGKLVTLESTAERCEVWASRPGQEPTTEVFEIKEARAAGLVKKDSNWDKWPKDMCYARCTARLARRYWPHVLGGCGYTPEELEEIGPDVAEPSPAPVADATAPQLPTRREQNAATLPTQEAKANGGPAPDIGKLLIGVRDRWMALKTAINPDYPKQLAQVKKADFQEYVDGVLGRQIELKPDAWTMADIEVVSKDLDNENPLPPSMRNAMPAPEEAEEPMGF